MYLRLPPHRIPLPFPPSPLIVFPPLSPLADHLEHQLAAVHDSIKVTLRKLGEAEESNKRRIEELERRLNEKVADKVEGSIAERLARVEAALEAKLKNDVLPQLQETVSSSSRTWLIPFLVLGVLLLLGFAYFFRSIRWLIKRETGMDLGLGYGKNVRY